MDRFVCIHGHFYQPPRENPSLDAVEVQDSAAPWHDWNERITAECYGPNARARVLDSDGYLKRVLNNYQRISFDVGPTLLMWLEARAPDVHQALIDADRASRARFSGHGSAMAQSFHHAILPLANARDRLTEVRWGIADFRRRFGREPEGFWLPETGVDTPTLETLAAEGIRFTVLAPSQARRVRPLGDGAWRDRPGGTIDPHRAYTCRLPSGRSIALFFYCGELSRAVAFDGVLHDGAVFADRLLREFDESKGVPQLVHVATDGETYGHHHRFGEMALAFALEAVENGGKARLTNYAEFLELFPPELEVEIAERTAWSCAHGLGRWESDCGCNLGSRGPAGRYHQRWRAPLRAALDELRDGLHARFTEEGTGLYCDPVAAREAYVDVVCDRSPTIVEAFLRRHARDPADDRARSRALRLLEMERQSLAMFTSCGWFFDDLGGIEGRQVLGHAARALELAEEALGPAVRGLQRRFLEALARAPCNRAEDGDGARLFEQNVVPTLVNAEKAAAHAGLRVLLGPTPLAGPWYAFDVELRPFHQLEAGGARLCVGTAHVRSRITLDRGRFAYAVLLHEGLDLVCGVRPFDGDADFATRAAALTSAFASGAVQEAVRLVEESFSDRLYPLGALVKDEVRRVVHHLLGTRLRELEGTYERLFESSRPVLRFVGDLGVPLPPAFRPAATFALHARLRKAILSDHLDGAEVARLVAEAKGEGVELDASSLAFAFRELLRRKEERVAQESDRPAPLIHLLEAVRLARTLPFAVELGTAEILCWKLGVTVAEGMRSRAARSNGLVADDAAVWLDTFAELAELLRVRVADEVS